MEHVVKELMSLAVSTLCATEEINRGIRCEPEQIDAIATEVVDQFQASNFNMMQLVKIVPAAFDKVLKTTTLPKFEG